MELRRDKNTTTRPARKRGNDTVGWYLDKIKDHDVLKHEQVVELFKSYKSGDKHAMNKLVESNLKLVVAVARSYRDKGVDWEDLLQEGNLGLIHAIEKFEWQRGHRFSTYATWWIRQRISHFLSTQRHSIRVPTHALRLKKHIESTIEMLRKSGEEPSWEKVAEIVGSSADVVEATVSASRSTVSLSRSNKEGDDNPSRSLERETRLKTVEGGDSKDDPEAPLARSQLKKALDSAVERLDPLSRSIVELRISAVDNGKLVLIQNIVDELALRGHVTTVNAVRTKLRIAMRSIADETCRAMGLDVSDDELDRTSNTRSFHDAVATILTESYV